MTGTHTYVIAEAGVNHDGSVETALRLVDAAADAGADCVKFQTFRADALAVAAAEKAEYQKQTTDAGETQRAMLARLELPLSAHKALLERAHARRIDFLSTPFDPVSLALLVSELGLQRIKVGSGDLTNAPLLLKIARAGRDVILSTGMATLEEVEEALSVLAFGYASSGMPSRVAFRHAWQQPSVRAALQDKVVLLHCTTEYPAPPETANLKAIDTLQAAFGLPVGYSDHTLGINVAVAAVAHGAVIIEKHVTLDRARLGPDHAASLEPRELAALIQAIRNVEKALGDGRKQPQPVEMKNIPIARKSLVAARQIKQGSILTAEDIASKRPGTGRAPIEFWNLVGTKALQDYEPDDLL